MNDIKSSKKNKKPNYVALFLSLWCIAIFSTIYTISSFKRDAQLIEERAQPRMESKINQQNNRAQNAQKQPDIQRVNNFPYDNVSLTEAGFVTAVIGEITNNSNKNYSMANFLISMYDEDGKLIGTGDIYVTNFYIGQTKTFQAATMPMTMDASKVSKYKMQFESGLEDNNQ